MPQNKQIDLDNHLFAELERLDDEELSPEQIEMEVRRARAMATVAAQINASRANSLRAAQFMDQAAGANPQLPEGFR